MTTLLYWDDEHFYSLTDGEFIEVDPSSVVPFKDGYVLKDSIFNDSSIPEMDGSTFTTS